MPPYAYRLIALALIFLLLVTLLLWQPRWLFGTAGEDRDLGGN